MMTVGLCFGSGPHQRQELRTASKPPTSAMSETARSESGAESEAEAAFGSGL